MGYRSDVVIRVKPSLIDSFQAMLKETGFDVCNDSSLPDRLVLNGVKWDDDRKDVNAVIAWMNNEDDLYFGCIILGEEYGDRDEYGSPLDLDIYVNQQIEVEGICEQH